MPRRSQRTRKKSLSTPRVSAGLPSGRRKSPLPSRLLIHGISIPVVLSECPDKEALGMFVNFPSPKIYINPDQPIEEQKSTLFHEALEAIQVIYGLELPEHVICTFEVGIRGLFRDNPGLRLFGAKI
jgi:hypothetical protein